MACNILSGYTNTCRDSIGGIKTIYITELSNKASATVITSTSGNITNVASFLSTGKKFWTFELTQATANYVQTPKPNSPNGSFYVEQTLGFKIPKFSATFSYQLKNLAQNDLMAIAYTMNGDYVLLGEKNGLKMQDSTQPSGTAMADFSGYDLVFKAEENDMALLVPSGIISLLTSPA